MFLKVIILKYLNYLKNLISIGESKNCKYEIIQHQNKPIFGTQFHPEMSLDGNNLIEKFCSL